MTTATNPSMAHLNPQLDQHYSSLNESLQPKLQSSPSVSLIRYPFEPGSAPLHTHEHETEDVEGVENPAKVTGILPFFGSAALKPQEDDSVFIAAIPVLVSLPLMVTASNLSLSSSISLEYVLPARLAMLLLQVCSILCVSKLLAKFKLAEPSLVRISVDLCLGLFFFYLALLVLSLTRTSVVYFCFFVNPWNVSAPVLLIYDVFSAYEISVASIGQVMGGYLALVCSFWLVSRALSSRPLMDSSPPFPVVCVLVLVLLALLLVTGAVDLPFLAITVASSSLLLFLVSHKHISLKRNILVIAIFSYCLECFVISTRPFSVIDAAVCVILPCLIKVKTFNFNFSPAVSVSEKSIERAKILTEILAHSDTRAIFNFLMLNSAFMFVQLLYSFRSKSLGLLSDSLHMALDCASLALGLVAGILLKNPIDANSKYPYGLKNFENLAGFANGTLLVGISGSIIFEAIGRLLHPVALQQTTELIVVSILGLLVNIAGIFAFNHGHSHSHGSHSHGHSHGHSHEHSHEHSHSHAAANEHSHADSHNNTAPTQSCEDSEETNDNMRGIFLHILADTLGSVGVVISTLLTKIFHWQGFDPVVSIIIAVLIFMTAVPLMKSTASTLLLKLDSKKEATVRSALNDLTTIKGIKSFTTPRFWASGTKLGGFIHIQVYRGESTAHLKKQSEEIFKKHNIDALIQMENDYDACWCRA